MNQVTTEQEILSILSLKFNSIEVEFLKGAKSPYVAEYGSDAWLRGTTSIEVSKPVICSITAKKGWRMSNEDIRQVLSANGIDTYEYQFLNGYLFDKF